MYMQINFHEAETINTIEIFKPNFLVVFSVDLVC